METSFVQRWRNGRQCYRPAGEVIVPTEYEVAPIGVKEAKTFVLEHHYLSRSYPACRFRFGLFRTNRLAGVAVFSHPCNDQVLSSIFGGAAVESVELGRFVLLDEVPANGESWFLSRCLKTLRREHLRGVLSFCDPMPRTSADGRVVHKGHIGVVYAATSGVYTGRSTARTLRLLPDGNVLSERAIQKIRSGEKGSRYASQLLVRFGAAPLTGNPKDWLRMWLARITRPLRHGGNHRFVWPLHPAIRKQLPPGLPYPKFLDTPDTQLPLLF
jgi:hypothetical protein